MFTGEAIEASFSLKPEELSRESVWFAMGYRGAVPEQRIRDMAEEVIERLVPCTAVRYMYRMVPAAKLSPTTMSLDGAEFKPGGIICSYLDGMTDACIFVATAGREFEAGLRDINAEGDIVTDFIADAIGTVLAELAVDRLEKSLMPELTLSMPYSPGYCGWDIREQHILFNLFPENPCGIRLTESSLMQPEKSVSGFFAMGEKLHRQPYHCEICKNSKCYKRRKG